MAKIVFVSNGLNCQGHESSGEKQSETIFQGKGELLIAGGHVSFHMREFVKDSCHHKFVENDDTD